MYRMICLCFFCFQAEDGIRDWSVTGVQTCALPIWSTNQNVAWKTAVPGMGWSSPIVWGDRIFVTSVVKEGEVEPPRKGLYRSEERRVGKECGSGGWQGHGGTSEECKQMGEG